MASFSGNFFLAKNVPSFDQTRAILRLIFSSDCSDGYHHQRLLRVLKRRRLLMKPEQKERIVLKKSTMDSFPILLKIVEK